MYIKNIINGQLNDLVINLVYNYYLSRKKMFEYYVSDRWKIFGNFSHLFRIPHYHRISLDSIVLMLLKYILFIHYTTN